MVLDLSTRLELDLYADSAARSDQNALASVSICCRARNRAAQQHLRMEQQALSNEDVAGRMELLGMIHAFVTPFVLKAAINLDIPDILARAGQALTAEEIMCDIKGRPLEQREQQLQILTRMLNFMATKNVLKIVHGDRYALTSVSKWLVRENNAEYLSPLLLMEMNDRCQASWQRLHEVVLEGGDAFDRANGGTFWDCGRYDSGFNAVVSNAMIAFSTTTTSLIVENYHGGFDGIASIVDVGGGMGHSVAKIVQAYPNVRGMNYDLPHVVAIAPGHQGVQHIGGDMFEHVPCADAVFVKSVLHNWDDDRCKLLLKNCNRALPVNGKLIVVDIVYKPSDKLAHVEANLDMIMVAYTTGGKERTPSEWQQLLKCCGFSRITFRRMPTKESVIEAFKLS